MTKGSSHVPTEVGLALSFEYTALSETLETQEAFREEL